MVDSDRTISCSPIRKSETLWKDKRNYFSTYYIIYCTQSSSVIFLTVCVDTCGSIFFFFFFNVWFQKIIIPTPRMVIENREKGGGVSKPKIFKGKYEAKLEIPGGERVQTKNILGWDMDISWNHTILQNSLIFIFLCFKLRLIWDKGNKNQTGLKNFKPKKFKPQHTHNWI